MSYQNYNYPVVGTSPIPLNYGVPEPARESPYMEPRPHPGEEHWEHIRTYKPFGGKPSQDYRRDDSSPGKGYPPTGYPPNSDQYRGRNLYPEQYGGRNVYPQQYGQRNVFPEQHGRRNVYPEQCGQRNLERYGQRNTYAGQYGRRYGSQEQYGRRNMYPGQYGGRDVYRDRRNANRQDFSPVVDTQGIKHSHGGEHFHSASTVDWAPRLGENSPPTAGSVARTPSSEIIGLPPEQTMINYVKEHEHGTIPPMPCGVHNGCGHIHSPQEQSSPQTEHQEPNINQWLQPQNQQDFPDVGPVGPGGIGYNERETSPLSIQRLPDQENLSYVQAPSGNFLLEEVPSKGTVIIHSRDMEIGVKPKEGGRITKIDYHQEFDRDTIKEMPHSSPDANTEPHQQHRDEIDMHSAGPRDFKSQRIPGNLPQSHDVRPHSPKDDCPETCPTTDPFSETYLTPESLPETCHTSDNFPETLPTKDPHPETCPAEDPFPETFPITDPFREPCPPNMPHASENRPTTGRFPDPYKTRQPYTRPLDVYEPNARQPDECPDPCYDALRKSGRGFWNIEYCCILGKKACSSPSSHLIQTARP